MKAIRILAVIVAVGLAAYFIYRFGQIRKVERLNNQAAVHINNNEFAQARPLLEQASRLDAKNPVIWKNLGVAYDGLDEDTKALEAFERSLALKPDQPDVSAKVNELRALLKQSEAQP
jgi:Flp pilus assembly protein TadD